MSLIWTNRAQLVTPRGLLAYNPIGLWIAKPESVRIYGTNQVDRWYNTGVVPDANRHAAQDTPADMATWTAANANFNGMGTVGFSNTQKLLTAAWSTAITPPFSVVVCLKFTGSATGINRAWLTDGTNGLKCVNYIATDNKLKTYNDSPAAIVLGPTMATAAQVISTKWVQGSSTCKLRTSVAMASPGSGSMAAGMSVPSVTLGNQFGYNSGIVGDMHSIGVFSGVLSDVDERTIMQLMAHGCGVTFTE